MKLRTALWSLFVVLLFLANLQLVGAHDLTGVRWFGDNLLDINILNYESIVKNALAEWERGTVLNFNLVEDNADIVVYGADFGNTGWGGLATLQYSYHCSCQGYCKIDSAIARYNSHWIEYENREDIQGVFCHEIGHTLGFLEHVDQGCMGYRYYNDVEHVTPHLRNDLNELYM